MATQRELILAAADIANNNGNNKLARRYDLKLVSPKDLSFEEPRWADEAFVLNPNTSEVLGRYRDLEGFIADMAMAGGVETTVPEILTLGSLIRILVAEREGEL